MDAKQIVSDAEDAAIRVCFKLRQDFDKSRIRNAVMFLLAFLILVALCGVVLYQERRIQQLEKEKTNVHLLPQHQGP